MNPNESAEDAVRRLHADGLSDVAIARRIGLTKQRVGAIRKQFGLPTQFEIANDGRHPQGRHDEDATDYDEVDRRAMAYRLFSQGCNDAHVAATVGIDLAAAERLRREMPGDWLAEYPAREPKPEPVTYAGRRGHQRGKAVA